MNKFLSIIFLTCLMEGKANATRLLIDSSGTVEIEMIILLIILCVIAFFWYMINDNGGFLNFLKNYKTAVKEEFKSSKKKTLRNNKPNKKK